MLGRSPDEAQEWLHSWTAQVSAQAQAAAELSDRVARLTATATGADGAVRVTVAASGALTDLRFDDRVRQMRGADLAEIVMTAIARAQASVTTQVAAAVHDTVGADSETGRAVVDSFARRFPGPPEERTNRQREAAYDW
ncbi:YbaB/EbfC family nucleoid-associated protein [Micromonospora sp. NPDC048871]|uniref:YbaB/EbfC family nucleoid-associated protein n=1 Tax=unclassified Micromonospora TaxID=2617518 RepID=UPI002E10A93E|nr:YbaB/EbfC family nucleoid-associated protein [Micromonospora sp. NBC_01739]